MMTPNDKRVIIDLLRKDADRLENTYRLSGIPKRMRCVSDVLEADLNHETLDDLLDRRAVTLSSGGK